MLQAPSRYKTHRRAVSVKRSDVHLLLALLAVALLWAQWLAGIITFVP